MINKSSDITARPCPKQCTLFRSLYLYNAKNITIFRYGWCIIYALFYSASSAPAMHQIRQFAYSANLDMNGAKLSTFSLNAKIHLFCLLVQKPTNKSELGLKDF